MCNSPKGILDALLLGSVDNDHVAVGVEVGMHRKDCQHLRPITCPCVTALVVVGNGGFAALWVRRHDVVDAAPKSALVSATISAIGMLLGSPDSSANKMPMGEPITLRLRQ